MHFDAGLRLSFWGFVFIIIKRRSKGRQGWGEMREGDEMKTQASTEESTDS